jgi:hypothetical protein
VGKMMGGSEGVGVAAAPGLGVGLGDAFLVGAGVLLDGASGLVALGAAPADVLGLKAVTPLLPSEMLFVRVSIMNTPPSARRIKMNDVRARPARRSTFAPPARGDAGVGPLQVAPLGTNLQVEAYEARGRAPTAKTVGRNGFRKANSVVIAQAEVL